jgi:hypothetical protein
LRRGPLSIAAGLRTATPFVAAGFLPDREKAASADRLFAFHVGHLPTPEADQEKVPDTFYRPVPILDRPENSGIFQSWWEEVEFCGSKVPKRARSVHRRESAEVEFSA